MKQLVRHLVELVLMILAELETGLVNHLLSWYFH